MLMPGDFNLACTELFLKDTTENFDTGFVNGMMPDEFDPEWIFKTTVALRADDIDEELTAHTMKDISAVKVINTKTVALEVTKIIKPDRNLVKYYSGVKSRDGKRIGTTRPVGIVFFKHCFIEDGWDSPRPTVAELESCGHEAFFFEEHIVDLLGIGFKLRAIVATLNCKEKFITQVLEVLPSFYTFLPQQLMLNYKEPVDNDRAAPSVDNPDAEEDQQDEIAEE